MNTPSCDSFPISPVAILEEITHIAPFLDIRDMGHAKSSPWNRKNI
jgi:hypothetical protein